MIVIIESLDRVLKSQGMIYFDLKEMIITNTNLVIITIISGCDKGKFGRNCNDSCDGCISNSCDVIDGLCVNTTGCEPGYYFEEYCNNICDDYYFGNNCTKQCHCLEKPCNNDDGICSPEGCKEGWHGKSCDQACDDWYFGNNCAWKCYCLTGPCNQLTGKCPPGGCQKGWHGVACEVSTVTAENKPLMSTHLGLFIGGFLLGILMATTACFLARKRRKLTKKQGKETVTENPQSHEQQHYDDVRMENISTYQDLMTRQTTQDYEHINTAFVRQ
ncbi:Hypothetical predicted protein [Mytilus galloprovincialis]|uniref:EGF-like domain-containing protein n=1 Tax=Mytilus galloprovincialis TaxID=29158 RepID=A0A8B6BRS1_MYTGA|nr:Hypothetical predicted protein [Mytilus galloprovincialis]